MKWSQGWKQKLLDMRELRSKTPPGSLPIYCSTGHSDQQNDARQSAWQHMRAPGTLRVIGGGCVLASPWTSKLTRSRAQPPLRPREELKRQSWHWVPAPMDKEHRQPQAGSGLRQKSITSTLSVFQQCLYHRHSGPGNLLVSSSHCKTELARDQQRWQESGLEWKPLDVLYLRSLYRIKKKCNFQITRINIWAIINAKYLVFKYLTVMLIILLNHKTSFKEYMIYTSLKKYVQESLIWSSLYSMTFHHKQSFTIIL